MMRRWFSATLFILIAALCYAGSAQLAAAISAPLLRLQCEAGLVNVICNFPGANSPDWRVYALIGASIGLLWIWAALFAKHWILYPFITLFGSLALGAIAYDLTFRNGLVSGPKLVNDTFNVLRLLIFASFALTFIMARRSGLRVMGVVAAVVLSYAASLAAMGGFIAVRAELFGAFELFVLYIVYAFGGFTLHLMTLSLLVSGARPAAREMSRSGHPLARIG